MFEMNLHTYTFIVKLNNQLSVFAQVCFLLKNRDFGEWLIIALSPIGLLVYSSENFKVFFKSGSFIKRPNCFIKNYIKLRCFSLVPKK